MNAGPRAYSRLLIGSMLLATLHGAYAANPTPPSPAAKPPATKPPAASSAGTATPPCEACHGANGEGMPAAHVPRIAGQSADYLEKQLNDYAEGTRDSPVMTNFAKLLSPQQRAKFAAHFASLSAPYLAESITINAQQAARGHQLAFQGDEAKRVQACNNCHGPDGGGLPHSAPYLAGQSAEFLASALKAWQLRTRKNDAGQLMRGVAERLSDADIAAVTGYFASLGSATH
jgi:cytochrome c553